MRGGREASAAANEEEGEAKGWKKSAAGALGYVVTAGACLTKIPQIKRCLESGSVEGVSLTSAYFETISLSSKILYHKLHDYPLSTWAENLALLAQQLVLVAIIWKLAEPAATPLHIAVAVACQVLYCGASLKLPEKYWPLLLVSKSVVTMLGLGSQIHLNFVNQSTGQLAWSPIALRVFGNVARLVTTLVFARKDLMLLFLYSTSGALNIALIAQFILYR